MTLTFSDFAKILYPRCGFEDTKAQFVITLTNKFMTRPEISIGDGYRNPMKNKNARSLQQYFSGERGIPKKDARIILGRSDKYRFESFINEHSDDTKQYIYNELKIRGISSAKPTNVEAICADIFEAILQSGKYEEYGDVEQDKGTLY